MIRLLLFCLISLSFFSCEEVYTQDDELFYQMSEADSARCMEEILDGIINEAATTQKLQNRIGELLYDPNIVVCGILRNVFSIEMNSSGQVMVRGDLDATTVPEKVYHYFMCNRFLSQDETVKAATNLKHPGFDYPFYNHFQMDEIDAEIDKVTVEWKEMKNTAGTEQDLIDYYYSKIEEWKRRKRTLEIIGHHKLIEIVPSASVRFYYQSENKQKDKLLNDISFAFYQMRNYESLCYFDETYLSLYERAQRLNRKIDYEKLEALVVLHPAKIVCRDDSKKRQYLVELPPEPTP